MPSIFGDRFTLVDFRDVFAQFGNVDDIKNGESVTVRTVLPNGDIEEATLTREPVGVDKYGALGLEFPKD